MSTISGPESVNVNWAPRHTRPGLRGRRRIRMCWNFHPIPPSELIMLPGHWRCRECGTVQRRWVWLCAPLSLEAWEWLLWSLKGVIRCVSAK
jgi:hypothetical protein